MSTAPIQKGTTVFLGYGSYTYDVILTDDMTVSPIADVSTINDEMNATTTVIVYNPGEHLDMSGVIKGTVVPTILLVGGTVSINAVTWRVEKYDIKLARTEAKLTLAAIKEASMTYT